MVLVNRLTPAIKVVVFLVCLIPLGLLVWNFVQGELGANPIEAVIHTTGDWTLRLLLISLSITPLKIITGNAYWIRFRRMLGLFAFFYATLHLCSYVVLDQFFDWSEIIRDIIKRPYITVGFLAWVLMIPLAITSTRKMMSRLGSRWKRLHKLVYWIAALGVLHFLWLVKADLREPLLHAGILAALLLVRFKPKLRT
jgi:sulfoxide reductase heme-binding subunit YedZ